MTTEIERKFLVSAPPPADLLGPGTRLRQGYLAEDGEVQVRIRITDAKSTMTVKAGHGLHRVEVEEVVDRAAAEALWPFTAGRRVEKVRHRVQAGGGLVADVDLYGGDLAGLCTAEVEFASVADAERFVPPPWCGRDVTGEPGWDNATLARRGRPR